MSKTPTMKDWIFATMDLVASESEKALEEEKAMIHSCLNDPRWYDHWPRPDPPDTLDAIEQMATEAMYDGPTGNMYIMRLIEIIRGLTVARDAKPDV